MKKLFLFLLLVGFVACSDNISDFGSKWVSVSTRNIIIDTCTINISTGMLDSVRTSNSENIFVGNFEDKYFGKTKSVGYFIFSPTTDDLRLSFDENNKERLYFDSLTMILTHGLEFCGDTTKPMKFDVYQLENRIEPNEDGEWYAHNSFKLGKKMASHEYTPGPQRRRTIEFRMSDSLGIKILHMLKTKSDTASSQNLFERFQKGFALVADESVNQILSFQNADTTFALKLYYHTSGDKPREEHSLIFRNYPELQMNHFYHDRSGTPTANVTGKGDVEIPSTNTENCSYIQGLSGMYTRISFPYLNEIQKLGTHGIVSSARLYIYPAEKSYGHEHNFAELSNNVALYISNESNVNMSVITDENEKISTGNLIIDRLSYKSTRYEYDVTEFIKDQVGAMGTSKSTLQMIVGKYGASTKNVVISQQDRNSDYKIKLEIKYSVYNEK